MSTDDTAPQLDTAAPPQLDELPPAPDVAPDTKPKRPTTRAGRRAASARAKAKKADKPPTSSKPTPRRATLETRLTQSLVSVGTMVTATGAMTSPAVQADGLLIIRQAPDIAAALDKVAKDDPRVAAALEKMLTVGVWGGLTAAVLPLVVGIAANHGAIPPHVAGMFGVAPPDELVAAMVPDTVPDYFDGPPPGMPGGI